MSHHVKPISSLEVLGSTTSPYVRRVRIVAQELGVPLILTDSMTDAGTERLRSLTPIWKVPTAVIDGETVIDSHSIIEVLLERCGCGPLRMPVPAHRIEEHNFIHIVDGALDSAIQLFYLRRDGLNTDSVAYLKKQTARISSAMDWIAARVTESKCVSGNGFGLSEIALLTTLGWMRLRNAYPVDDVAAFNRFESAWASRPSVSSTLPSS